MKTFCLMPNEVNKLKRAILSGDINPEKLSQLSSKETEAHLAKFLSPESAKQVNILYEKKLLLKKQDRAIYNLFKDILGLSETEKLAKAEKIKAELARKNARLFNPVEGEKVLESYINDMLSRRFKVGISTPEAKKIIELSNKIKRTENFKTIKKRIKHGRAKIALYDYVNKLSGKKPNILTNVLGLPRAVMASLDLSAPLNQGWGMLSRKEFYNNLGTMFKAAKNERAYLDIQAEIITRDTYRGAKRAGLRITDLGDNLSNREEAFMTTLLNKIPGFNASQRAYTAFLNKVRMDVYDNLVKQAYKYGEDVSIGSKTLEDIASSVNIFTGGYGKTSPILNDVLFSPRKVQSSLQILNPLTYINPKISKTARMASLRNVLGSLAITATMLKTASALCGDDVEIEQDPTSADFGKLKINDARIDVSGGNAGYITLLSRILSQQIKSSNTGVKTKLGEGYGKSNAFELIAKFGRNKLSPAASWFIDVASGSNAIGEKKTITQSTIDRFKPMFLNNVYELYKSDTKYKEPIAILALFGANISIYDVSENWKDKDTKEINQFKEQFGDEILKEANDKYNEIIKFDINEFKKSEDYKVMTNEARAKQIQWIKNQAQKRVFNEYNFKVKKSLPSNK